MTQSLQHVTKQEIFDLQFDFASAFELMTINTIEKKGKMRKKILAN